jgi:hypothetical protein
MSDDRDRRTPSIGDQLDCIRWDYNPPVRERRFFLSPMSTFFGAFAWEGAAQTMPVPPSKTTSETPSTTARNSKPERAGAE